MGDKDTATRLLAGYAGIMATVAAFRSHVAAAAEGQFTLDKETKELLAAIAESSAETLSGVAEILQAVLSMQLNVQGYAPNADYIVSTRVVCAVAMQSYPVPDFIVPDDFHVLVKAWPWNAVGSLTYVATNPAPNPQMAHPLIFNESIPFRIKNTGKLWIFSDVAGSQAVITVEQRT